MASYGWPSKVLRGCLGKTKHSTQGKAWAAARAIERMDAREGKPPIPVRAYPCPRCHHWHAGHVSQP